VYIQTTSPGFRRAASTKSNEFKNEASTLINSHRPPCFSSNFNSSDQQIISLKPEDCLPQHWRTLAFLTSDGSVRSISWNVQGIKLKQFCSETLDVKIGLLKVDFLNTRRITWMRKSPNTSVEVERPFSPYWTLPKNVPSRKGLVVIIQFNLPRTEEKLGILACCMLL